MADTHFIYHVNGLEEVTVFIARRLDSEHLDLTDI